jgi:hypothetical protein
VYQDNTVYQDRCPLADPPAVAVPCSCVYDINFLAKAWAEKTRITLEGIAGLIVGLTNMSDGKIAVEILIRGARKTVYVVAK